MKEIRKFTLIELVVVASILAVTAAMLLPAVQSANTQAQTTQCIGNLKEMCKALFVYAKNNNNHIEGLTSYSGYENRIGLPWSKNMLDIIKNEKVFLCPADTTGNDRRGKPAKCSYGAVQLSGSIWPERWKSVTLDRFTDPAKFMHIMDSHGSWNNIGHASGSWQVTLSSYKDAKRAPMYAPHEGATVTAASHYDGSVRTYTYPAGKDAFPGDVKERVFF
jgi:Tfp pilus assembly major pilin PilA